MPRNPDKTPCSHPECRAWAIRGSDPALCSAHAGRASASEQGEGCGRCVGAPPGNQHRRTHGFYSRILQPEEAKDLRTLSGGLTLDDEIAIARVALRRIFAMLHSGATPGPDPQPIDSQDYVRLLGLAFRGTGAISRLLRVQIQLPGCDNDGIHQSISDALDELGEMWGIDL